MIKKIDEYTFYAEYRNSRTGFAHSGELYYQSQRIAKAKINYYNRTWEEYAFQSLFKQLVSKAIKEREFFLQEEAKNEFGANSMRPAKVKNLYQELINSDNKLKELKNLYKCL